MTDSQNLLDYTVVGEEEETEEEKMQQELEVTYKHRHRVGIESC